MVENENASASHHPSQDLLDPLSRKRPDDSLAAEPNCPTLAEVLTYARPRLSDALLDADGYRAVHDIARQIPSLFSTFWGLEIRLGDPLAGADILWELRRESPGADLLAGMAGDAKSRAAIDAVCARSDVWQRLRQFAQTWRGADSSLSAICNIWLEVDSASAMDQTSRDRLMRRPCLFWGADPERQGSDRRLLDTLPSLASEIFDLALPPDQLARAAAPLPDHAEIFQLGAMAARQGTVARLCLRGMNPTETATWLTDIRWPGDTDAVYRMIHRLRPMTGRIALNVDILPYGTGPKLGLELYRSGEGIDFVQWRPLLDEISGMGLILREKYEALSVFPWQERFSQTAAFQKDRPVGHPVIVQSLHHIKLVFVEDRAVEAKAYLGVFRPGFDYSGFVGGEEASQRGGWIVT